MMEREILAAAFGLIMLSWGVYREYGLHWMQIAIGAVMLINFWIG